MSKETSVCMYCNLQLKGAEAWIEDINSDQHKAKLYPERIFKEEDSDWQDSWPNPICMEPL